MSTSELEQRLQELTDKQEIAELSHNYMRGLDRLDRELMLSVFHPDSTTDYGFFKGSGPDFVDYAQNALKDHISNQHMIGHGQHKHYQLWPVKQQLFGTGIYER